MSIGDGRGTIQVGREVRIAYTIGTRPHTRARARTWVCPRRVGKFDTKLRVEHNERAKRAHTQMIRFIL